MCCLLIYITIKHHLSTAYYRKPKGFNMRSLTVLTASSPPLCKANAPMMLYIVCANTVSTPLPCRLSLFFGFHRTTFSTPKDLATCATRAGARICALLNEEILSTPSREGWLKTFCSPGTEDGGAGAWTRAIEVCRSTRRFPRKARRSLKPWRPWSNDLCVTASHYFHT